MNNEIHISQYARIRLRYDFDFKLFVVNHFYLAYTTKTAYLWFWLLAFDSFWLHSCIVHYFFDFIYKIITY